MLDNLTAQLNQLESKQTNFESLVSGLSERKKELENEYNDLMTKENEIKASLEKNSQEKKVLMSYLDEITQKLALLDTKIDTLETQRQKLIGKKRDIDARKKALQELREQFLSRHKAVRAILSLKNKQGYDGIIGTIHDIIKVPPEYNTAISASIGSKFDYIIVRDDTTAAKCINYLKENKIGRVTLLPLNILRPRPQPPLSNDIDGVVGPALSLIDIDEKYLSAVQFLLGNTLIVTNIDVARKLHRIPWKKVTLDGDIVEASGLMRGGHVQQSQVIPLEDSEESIAKLTAEIDRLSDLLTRLTRERIEIDKIREEKLLELNKLESTQSYLRQQEQELTAKKDSILEKMNQIDERISEYKQNMAVIKTKLVDLKTKINKHKEKLQEMKIKRALLQTTISTTKLTELNDTLDKMRQKRDEIVPVSYTHLTLPTKA